MRASLVAAALLLSLTFSTGAFAQSTVSTLNGIVTDTSSAALPGVTVKVLNEDTGIAQSMLSNDTGAYSFILLPGTNYTISATLDGFKTTTINKIALRMADTVRVDVKLEVGGIEQKIIVDARRDKSLDPPTNLITLDEAQITGLPLVGNDPLALITTLPGYRANPYGHEYDTVGGLPMYMMNTVRDGLSVTDGFSPGGVGSNTIMNPDMISEIRLILAPVDAEAGRGNGQIQITTKSGTNKFQWNINYNIRQNALNALGPSTTRFPQPFGVTFQYVVSVGGPIIKNKTFYFVNWDHQLRFERSAAATPFGQAGFAGSGGFLSVPVMTDEARNGIFRYFDGWVSGNPVETRPAIPPGGTAPRWPIEMHQAPDGRFLPIAPTFWADTLEGSTPAPYTGSLKCYSVFGNIKFDGTPFNPAEDCGQYIPRMDNGAGGTAIDFWVPDYANPVYGVGVLPDPSIRASIPDPSAPNGMRVTWESGSKLFDRPPDRSGYVQRLLAVMPRANEWNSSSFAGGQLNNATTAGGNDVLNRAQHSWVRRTNGRDNRNTFRGGTFGFGTSLDQSMVAHKIINLKVDHNIGSHSRISLSTSMQTDQNSRLFFQSRWPEGANGYASRVPRVLTLNGISTISPTMVNEARFGLNYNRSTQLPPWDNPNQAESDYARSFLVDGWVDPNNSEISPIYFLPGSTNTNFNWQDNVLPFGVSGANAGLQANVGFGANGSIGPIASGCTPAGQFSFNGSGASTVNCETGSSLFNFADTFSWNRGSHSIRAGAELRLTRANELSSRVIPQAAGGASLGTASDLALTGVLETPEMPGFDSVNHGGRMAATATNSAELLYVLSGSVANVNQTFWVNTLDNYKNGTWETWSIGDGTKARRSVQNEYALFFKDDWRIGQRLTLNLGVRYENYGNLFVRGFATGILDEGYGLFGAARTGREGVNPFDYWLTPGNTYYTGYGRGCTYTAGNPSTTCAAGSFVPGGGQIPDVDVTGTFLPNGQPNYIPGNCPINTITAGTTTTTNVGAGNSGANVVCANVGGVDPSSPTGYVQFVPASYVAPGQTGRSVLFTPAVNCVYGVQQNALLPVSNCDPSLLTSRVFVGPGSDHPKQAPLYRDRNNIGPAIGFSYRMPLGSRTLLIRGGFQYTFGSAGRDRSIGTGSAGQLSQQGGGGIGTAALDQVTRTCNSASSCLGSSFVDANYALTISDLPNLIPLQTQMYNDPQYYRPAIGASGGGGGAGAVGDRIMLVQNFGVQRNLSATAYAPGYQDPRTENYTFSVSTNLTRTSSVAMSYVGTLGRNRPTGINLNTPNIYHNPELLDALNRTRAGEDAPLFDQIFAGWNLTGLAASAGWGPVGTCVTMAGAPGLIDPTNNINCPSGTVYQSGSAHLRNASATNFANLRTNLANGNFLAVATALASASPGTGGCVTNAFGACVTAGQFTTGYRNATHGAVMIGNLLRNGCDRLGSATAATPLNLINGGASTGNTGPVRCLPEDWLIMNPSLSMGQGVGANSGGTSVNGNGVIYKDTWGYTNYHQFQIQYTMRLNSVNLQATYLTSKTLALPRDFYRTNTFDQNALGGTALGSITGFSDPKSEESRRKDYGESSDSLKHAIRMNGVFQLPIGPGKPFLSKAPGWVHRILGGWQMGIIYNLQSGAPFSIQAGDTMYGAQTGVGSLCDAYAGVGFSGGTNCTSGLVFPDVVSPLWNNPKGKMVRDDNGVTTYFGNPNPFSLIADPQCTNGPVMTGVEANRVGSTSLASVCSLRSLVLKVPVGTPGAFPLSATDPTPVLIMLQNPTPGRQGSLGGGTMRQPGRYYLDANLSKTFMFTESRGIQIRVDATNVLNHPTPSDVFLNLGPQATSIETTLLRFNESTNDRSALASGCIGSNAFCGRQVQFGIRMINN